jgi:hypothetical protein
MPNYAVTPTIYPDHETNTYKAYATVGGSVVLFLGEDGRTRTIDGGHLYPSHKNAQTRARQLNFPIKYAMKRAAKKYDFPMVEAYHDGYTACVELMEDPESSKNVYRLSVRVGEMPPHSSQIFETIDQVEEDRRTNLFFPLTVEWKAVKGEEI